MTRSGQALIEYVLLLGILVGLFATFSKKLSESPAFANLQRPLTQEFATTYRYGHPKARGQDDGGPLYLPQYNESENTNFRIFINPMTPDER